MVYREDKNSNKSSQNLVWYLVSLASLQLEKEIAALSNVPVWRIPGMGEPDGLPSLRSRRVGHDWSDLAAAAAVSLQV